MTLLRVSDQQQDLTNKFVSHVKRTVHQKEYNSKIQQDIYLMGQEMGFCNDEIRVLLEDILPTK